MRKQRGLHFLFGLAVTGLLVTGFAAGLRAQARGSRGQGPKYDPATEVTVKGTVEEVKQINQNQGWGGIHLTVRTEQGNLNVHVGPSWFLEKNKMSFEKGDTVEITGSKVKFGGEDALIAREIKKNGVPLTLRNAQGIPVWAGGPRANY